MRSLATFAEMVFILAYVQCGMLATSDFVQTAAAFEDAPVGNEEIDQLDPSDILSTISNGERAEKLRALKNLRQLALKKKLAANESKAIDLCVQLLQDPDNELKQAASDAICWMSLDAIPPLVPLLLSDDDFIKSSAAMTIGFVAGRYKVGDDPKIDKAIPPLAQLLKHENMPVRFNAAYAISRLGPASIAYMIKEIENEDLFVKISPGFVRHPETSIELLCDALNSDHWLTRRNALRMLTAIVRKNEAALPLMKSKALDRVMKAIDDENAEVVGSAIETLGFMGPVAKPAIDKIVDTLKKPDPPFRYIAQAVERIGPEVHHIDPLFDGLKLMREQTDDRDTGIAMFGSSIGAVGKKGVPTLVVLLDHESYEVRTAALIAVDRIGPDAVAAVPKLIEAVNRGENQALYTLGSIGPAAEEAIPHLIKRMENDEWWRGRGMMPHHQSIAARTLAAIGREAVPSLLEGLKHENDLVRAGCAVALAEMDSEVMVPLQPLETLTLDEHPTVRAQAVATLIKRSAPKEMLLPILKRMQNDPVGGVATLAKRALKTIQEEKQE